jgi:hypothetical protein
MNVALIVFAWRGDPWHGVGMSRQYTIAIELDDGTVEPPVGKPFTCKADALYVARQIASGTHLQDVVAVVVDCNDRLVKRFKVTKHYD